MSKQSDFNRRKRAESADIGPIPPVLNPERKDRCRGDLHSFLVEYFPETTGMSAFSPEQVEAIKRIEICFIEGGVVGNVFPRGFAKTTIGENAVLWAILYGHRKFVPLFGADEESALQNLSSIKRELEQNERLFEDFPEVCIAIEHLKGSPQRAWHQTHIPGNIDESEVSKETIPERTHVEWKADTITLPTIYGVDGKRTSASGGRVLTRGLESGARGMKYKDTNGKQVRPDIAVIDDPQTDGSAQSPTQVRKRLSIIQKSIMRLGSHNKRMSVLMNATIIQPGDLIETMMDRKRFPAWQFYRMPMMKSMASPDVHEKMWMGEYREIRNKYDQDKRDDQKRAWREATAYYRAHFEEMNKGAVATWGECYDKELEISAVQHAYNILIDEGPEVFASECQNEPKAENVDSTPQLSAAAIIERLNHIERGVIPSDCDKLTAFIDVQGEVLFWMVVAWATATFAGNIVDYGSWPEQPSRYFDIHNLRYDLTGKYPDMEKSAMLTAGLTVLRHMLDDRKWVNERGDAMTINRGLIDYGWEESEKAVFAACRGTNEIWIPSKGKGISATRTAFDSWKPMEGVTYGKSWRISRHKRGVPALLFETNFWKTSARNLLMAPVGSVTSMMLYGGDPAHHRMLGDHLAGERATLVTADGRTILEWDNEARREQHQWDALVGNLVAASTVGVKTPEQHEPRNTPQKRSLKAMQAKRREDRRGR